MSTLPSVEGSTTVLLVGEVLRVGPRKRTGPLSVLSQNILPFGALVFYLPAHLVLRDGGNRCLLASYKIFKCLCRHGKMWW